MVFVRLPGTGASFKQGDPFGTVESVKAISDVHLPLSGEIIEINSGLLDTPELLNRDPYGRAWLVKLKISSPGELANLLDSVAYQQHCEDRAR